MKNKIIALLIALTILGQVPLTASAISTSGGTGKSSAILRQEQTSFNVTVPTGLPITVDSAGGVITATDAKIHNNSYGPIIISDVRVDISNGWSLVDFNKDMSKSKVGLKEFGLSLQNDKVQSDGSIALTPSSWESIPGNGHIDLNYDAIISPQKTALSNVNIADVIFVLGWDEAPSKYVLATDDDFDILEGGYTPDGKYFHYIGDDEYVEVPHTIKSVNVTSYYNMFKGTSVKGVKSTNNNVTDMISMFYNSNATELDLSKLDTSNVTNMRSMFGNSKATTIIFGSSFCTSQVTNMAGMFNYSRATELDLSNFNTANVTDMSQMFYASHATTLDLSNFDTSNVTNMRDMFMLSKATELDLSELDTSNVTDMGSMFASSKATTGYARTQPDADRLNTSTNIPTGLTFIVK